METKTIDAALNSQEEIIQFKLTFKTCDSFINLLVNWCRIVHNEQNILGLYVSVDDVTFIMKIIQSL